MELFSTSTESYNTLKMPKGPGFSALLQLLKTPSWQEVVRSQKTSETSEQALEGQHVWAMCTPPVHSQPRTKHIKHDKFHTLRNKGIATRGSLASLLGARTLLGY